jgi:hypothetical protein
MGYTSLENIYERYFQLIYVNRLSIDFIDNSIPWELSVFVDKINQYLEESANKENQ